MEFHIFQCEREKDCFVVTDAAHEAELTAKVCPYPDDKLVKVGVFGELGDKRVAFDEGLAKRSIEKQGYFRFTAKSFDPVVERPLTMP